MPDIEYKTNGFFYRLFPPMEEQAIEVFRQIASVFPFGEIPASAWKGVKKQITDAGYTVARHRVNKMSASEIDDLMKELKDAGAFL